MDKSMYVNVDVGEYQEKIIKSVSEDYKSKTFGELLDKMTDGSADEFNESGYNAKENFSVETLKKRLELANKNPGEVNVYALSNSEPPEEIYVNLSDIVSDYNDRIIKYDSIINNGVEQKFQKFDLLVIDNASGGLEYRLIG